MKKITTILLGLAIVAGTSVSAQASTSLTGQGSSYVNALVQSCKSIAPGADVTYMATGSGTGKSQFAGGLIDFAATDSPYTEQDIKPNFSYGYVPLAGGPIAIVFNIKNVRSLKITNKIVSDIYTGKIKKWNDKAITAVNPGVKLPSTTITPVFRSDGSGTSANFATYLAATVKGAGWKAESTSFGSSNSKSKIFGMGSAKSTGIAGTVGQVNGSIGYLDLSDANAMRVNYASLKNEAGQFIKPTVMNSSAFINVQKLTSSGLVKFDYTKKVKNGYNLSLVSYALVPLTKSDKSTSLKTFFSTLLKTCGPANGPKLGYAVLSGNVKTLSLKTVASIGTK